MVLKPLASLLVGILFIGSQMLGCTWDYSVWSKSGKSDTPLFRFVVNERYGAGYIDRSGRIVLQPQFLSTGNHGGDFFEGLANVSTKADGAFYMDASGNRIAPATSWVSGDFSEGLATRWFPDEKKYGYIDHTGKTVIPAAFDHASIFSEGLAAVRLGERYGYIDHTGQTVIPARFAYAGEFSEKRALVIENGECRWVNSGPCAVPPSVSVSPKQRCRYSIIDSSGKVLLAARHIQAKRFSEGLAPVGDGKSWGYVDYAGEVRIPMQFEDAEPFSHGLARVRRDGKIGFIDKTGEMVIQPQFLQAEDFSEGLAVVVDDATHRYSFIDAKGKRAIAGDFDGASSFVFGLAHVRVGLDYYSAKWSYIDRQGNVIFTYADQSDRQQTPR